MSGTFHIDRTMQEKRTNDYEELALVLASTLIRWILTAWKDQRPLKLKQPANVVPSQEDNARRRSMKVGRIFTNSTEYPAAFSHKAM